MLKELLTSSMDMVMTISSCESSGQPQDQTKNMIFMAFSFSQTLSSVANSMPDLPEIINCDEVCKAVSNVLLGLNEYNGSGRYILLQLWNLKESLKEAVECTIQELKTQKIEILKLKT
ncbi:Factor of DNA methylation 1-5/IDN2 [Theobroma cacao]|nr:Factor of DNA methylation 1-5/IDN2 [Theobroma cacao]